MDKKAKIAFNVMAVILIIAFCISITPVSLQNDTYYTIKIGEYILENGITMQDPFSWHENLPYTFPHWAYDVATYLVYNSGGYLGIYIATAALASVLGLAIYYTNTKRTKNNLISFLLTLGVMYLLKDYIAARAQLVTFILFILTVYFIEQFLDTKKKRYAVFLIIIPIIIANVHLAVWPFYFVLFLPYVGEYIVALISNVDISFMHLGIKKLKKKIRKTQDASEIEKMENKIIEIQNNEKVRTTKKAKFKETTYKLEIVKNDNVKWLVLIMIICAFTGLLTPLNGTPYTYLINTMQGNTTQNINEHLPLTLINNVEFLGVIIIFLAILMFTDTKIRLRDFFMMGGLLLLAFKTRRQVSMFVLICSLILNRLLNKIFEKYDKGGCEKLTKIMVTLPGKLITAGIVLILCFAFVKPKIDDNYVDDTAYPVAATEYIKNNIDIENMKLYNEYNYGSYLLMKDVPVFIDSRADLYAPEFNGGRDIFSDFLNISNIGTYYEDKFEEYGITHVIIYKNAKLNMFISRNEKYKELYSDDCFCVYERLK